MTTIRESLQQIVDGYSRIESPLDKKFEGTTEISVGLSKEEITAKYLTPSTTFSKEWLNRLQELPPIDKTGFARELFTLPKVESRTGTRFKRAGLEGRIVGHEEFSLPGRADANAKNSLSMNRQMGSKLDFVRGRAGFMPFQPGGLNLGEEAQQAEAFATLHRDNQGIYDVPPGLSRGLVGNVAIDEEESKRLNEDDEDLVEDDIEEEEQIINEVRDTKSNSHVTTDADLTAIDDLLPAEISYGRTKTTLFEKAVKSKDWAHIVDVNKTLDNFSELVPQPAREFPFELDVFQKEAVYHLEQGDSVFVAAHTSAGKTVVAEYAISMAQRNMTKVIYTSPIKALSNQKYRDFKKEYDDVGILTGDVQINAEAACLIMTTEILRSMLYRGADLIRDVEFVIFDEVHYVNDQDRGVVWEEVIIMLPDHIKFILLSATVPNTFEFANWVGRTKQKDIYVISTPKRPVPLVHYLWAKSNMYEIVDAQKKFIESGYKKVEVVLNPQKDALAGAGGRGGANAGAGGRGRGGATAANGRGGRGGAQRGGAPRGRGNSSAVARGRGGFQGNSGRQMNQNMPGKTTFTQMIQHLHKQKLLPVVIFVFSKKRCEEYAMMLTSIDYCTAKEKSEIRAFIDKAVSRLKQEDRELPQIMRVRDLLSRGIGVHHGGLLPIVKEVIEILFAKSLVKVLFATETFAMGLNLPTRTVVFASTRKHDGHSFRNLLPGEYTQMAGRAGRRGLDTTGTVIIMANGPDPPPAGQLKDMMLGTPTKLQSQFRLTYNMILNLLRIEALKVEEMIKRSFSENAAQVLLPEHEKSVKLNEATLEQMIREPCEICDKDIEQFHEMALKYEQLSKELLSIISRTPIGRGILQPGRLVVFQIPGQPRELGLVVRFIASKEQLHVLACSKFDPNDKDCIPFLSFIKRYGKQHLRQFQLAKGFSPRDVDLSCVQLIMPLAVKENVAELLRGDREAVKLCQSQLSFALKMQTRWQEIRLNKVRNADANLLMEQRQKLIDDMSNTQCITCPTFTRTYRQVHEKHLIRQKIDDLKHLISDQNLELLPDYEQRINVLKDLSYIDEESNVLLKGRVACEVSTGFELIITELVLDNFLGEYEPEEMVALLSCFVFEGNTQVETESVTPRLDTGKARILEIANKVNQVFEQHQVLITQEESQFAESKRFGLMEAVYEWARGMSFHKITELTDVAEGTIVRVITRLDEVCRQVMAAARIIGDTQLYERMEVAQEKIKRDIVFCASLYI